MRQSCIASPAQPTIHTHSLNMFNKPALFILAIAAFAAALPTKHAQDVRSGFNVNPSQMGPSAMNKLTKTSSSLPPDTAAVSSHITHRSAPDTPDVQAKAKDAVENGKKPLLSRRYECPPGFTLTYCGRVEVEATKSQLMCDLPDNAHVKTPVPGGVGLDCSSEQTDKMAHPLCAKNMDVKGMAQDCVDANSLD